MYYNAYKKQYILVNSKTGLRSINEYDTYEKAYNTLMYNPYENVCDMIYEVTFKEVPVVCPYEEELNKILDISIDKLNLTTRLYNVLINNNIKFIKDIYNLTCDETENLKGLGKKLFRELWIKLLDYNITRIMNKSCKDVWCYDVAHSKRIKERLKRKEETENK